MHLTGHVVVRLLHLLSIESSRLLLLGHWHLLLGVDGSRGSRVLSSARVVASHLATVMSLRGALVVHLTGLRIGHRGLLHLVELLLLRVDGARVLVVGRVHRLRLHLLLGKVLLRLSGPRVHTRLLLLLTRLHEGLVLILLRLLHVALLAIVLLRLRLILLSVESGLSHLRLVVWTV